MNMFQMKLLFVALFNLLEDRGVITRDERVRITNTIQGDQTAEDTAKVIMELLLAKDGE